MNKFLVGDLVRVTKSSREWGGYAPQLDAYIGEIGEVVSSGVVRKNVYCIDFKDGETLWYFPEWVLEFADDGIEPGDLSGLLKYKDGSI